MYPGNVWECLEEHLQMLTVVRADFSQLSGSQLQQGHKGFYMPPDQSGVRLEDDLKLVPPPEIP